MHLCDLYAITHNGHRRAERQIFSAAVRRETIVCIESAGVPIVLKSPDDRLGAAELF